MSTQKITVTYTNDNQHNVVVVRAAETTPEFMRAHLAKLRAAIEAEEKSRG